MIPTIRHPVNRRLILHIQSNATVNKHTASVAQFHPTITHNTGTYTTLQYPYHHHVTTTTTSISSLSFSQHRYFSNFSNEPKDQWYIHKPKLQFPNEQARQNYERYKAAEERAKLIYNQRLYADMAGVAHDDPTAYSRVQTRNWLTAVLLVAFVGGVYWYSTRRIITADDTFDSAEMQVIQREVEEEIEAQSQEIERERRGGAIVKATDMPSSTAATNRQQASSSTVTQQQATQQQAVQQSHAEQQPKAVSYADKPSQLLPGQRYQ